MIGVIGRVKIHTFSSRHNYSDETEDYIEINIAENDFVSHPRYYVGQRFNNDVAVPFLPNLVEGMTPVTLNEDPKVPEPEDPLDMTGRGNSWDGVLWSTIFDADLLSKRVWEAHNNIRLK